MGFVDFFYRILPSFTEFVVSSFNQQLTTRLHSFNHVVADCVFLSFSVSYFFFWAETKAHRVPSVRYLDDVLLGFYLVFRVLLLILALFF